MLRFNHPCLASYVLLGERGSPGNVGRHLEAVHPDKLTGCLLNVLLLCRDKCHEGVGKSQSADALPKQTSKFYFPSSPFQTKKSAIVTAKSVTDVKGQLICLPCDGCSVYADNVTRSWSRLTNWLLSSDLHCPTLL